MNKDVTIGLRHLSRFAVEIHGDGDSVEIVQIRAEIAEEVALAVSKVVNRYPGAGLRLYYGVSTETNEVELPLDYEVLANG